MANSCWNSNQYQEGLYPKPWINNLLTFLPYADAMSEMDPAIALLLEEGGISVYSAKKFVAGATNGAYLLETDKGQIVLRQLASNLDPTAPSQETAHLLHRNSHEQGAPIPALIMQELIPYKNSRLQLIEYIPGISPIEIDLKDAQRIGSAIAEFQKAAMFSKNLFHKPDITTAVLSEMVRSAMRSFSQPLQEAGYLGSVAYTAKEYFGLVKAIRTHNLPVGIVHNDVTPNNIIKNDEGKILLLDIDQARIGCLASDLCSAIYHYSLDGVFNRPITEALIEGYE